MRPDTQPRPWPPEDEVGEFNAEEISRMKEIMRSGDHYGYLALVESLERQLATFREEAQTWLDLTNSLNAEIGSLQKQLEGVVGERDRLQESIDSIGGLWACPDCGAKSKHGFICSGCGLNHPNQSKTMPLSKLPCPCAVDEKHAYLDGVCNCGAISPNILQPQPHSGREVE